MLIYYYRSIRGILSCIAEFKSVFGVFQGQNDFLVSTVIVVREVCKGHIRGVKICVQFFSGTVYGINMVLIYPEARENLVSLIILDCIYQVIVIEHGFSGLCYIIMLRGVSAADFDFQNMRSVIFIYSCRNFRAVSRVYKCYVCVLKHTLQCNRRVKRV